MNAWNRTAWAAVLVVGLLACAPAGTSAAREDGGPAVTPEQFAQEVEGAKGLVLVDFWAPWCGPCRKMKPTFEKVEPDYAGKVKFVKVDVDQSGKVAEKYSINAIPHLMLFRDGKVVDHRLGLQSERELRAWLDEQVKAGAEPPAAGGG